MDRTSTSVVAVAIEGSIIRKKKIKGGDWIVVTIRTHDVINETSKQNDVNESWVERKPHQLQQQHTNFYNVHIHKSMIMEEGGNHSANDKNRDDSTINLSKEATIDGSVYSTTESILDANCNTTCEGVKSQNSHRIDAIPSCCLFLQSIVQVCGFICVDEIDEERHLGYSNEILQPYQSNQAEDSNAITHERVDPNTVANDPIAKVYAESIKLVQCAPDPFAVRYIIENQIFSKERSLQTRNPNLSSTLDDSSIQPQSQLQQQQHHQQQVEEQQHKIQESELYWIRSLFPMSCSMYQDQLNLFEKDTIEQKIKRSNDTNPMTPIVLSNIIDEARTDFPAPHHSKKKETHSTETIQVYERLYLYLLRNAIMIDPCRLRQQRLLIAKIVRGIQNLPSCHTSIKKPQQQQIELSTLHRPIPNRTEKQSATTTSDANDDNKDDLHSSVHDQHHKAELRNGKPRTRLPRLTPKDLQQFERLEQIVRTVVSKSEICFRLTTADPSDNNQEMSGMMQSCSRTHPDEHINIGDNSHPQKKSKQYFDMDHTTQDVTHEQDGRNLRALHNVLNLPGIQNNNANENAFMNCQNAGSDDEPFVLSDSNAIMSTRGTLSRREYLLDKKHPQIEWIVRRFKTLSSPLSTTSNPKISDKQAQYNDHDRSILVANRQNYPFLLNQQPNHILDVGGGRGDLAVALQLEFPSIHVTIIDTNQRSLDAARVYAKMMKCDLEHFHFICIDFYDYVVSTTERSKNATPHCTVVEDKQYQQQPTTIPPIDFVVALHACGDLSDLALFYAQRILQCRFIICPCCYTKQYIAQRSLQATATTTTSAQCYNETNDGVNDNNMESPFSAPWRRLLDDLSVGTADSERSFLSSNMRISGQTSNVQLKKVLEQPKFEDQCPHNTMTASTVVNKELLREELGTKEWKSRKHQLYHQVLLGKLAELNERPSICQRAMTTINSLRLQCVILPDTAYCTAVNNVFFISSHERGLDVPSSLSKRAKYEVSLEEYDSSLSRRNQVLVGVPCFD